EISATVGGTPSVSVQVNLPEDLQGADLTAGEVKLPSYTLGEKVATRQAYGDALAAIGEADKAVVALDAEVSNSTFGETMKKVDPLRFVEIYIAEQQMVSTAVGLQNRRRKPFCST